MGAIKRLTTYWRELICCAGYDCNTKQRKEKCSDCGKWMCEKCSYNVPKTKKKVCVWCRASHDVALGLTQTQQEIVKAKKDILGGEENAQDIKFDKVNDETSPTSR